MVSMCTGGGYLWGSVALLRAASASKWNMGRLVYTAACTQIRLTDVKKKITGVGWWAVMIDGERRYQTSRSLASADTAL